MATPGSEPPPSDARPRSGVARLFQIQPDEVAVVLWSCASFFFLLSSYFVLRPVREAMGLTGGVDNLPYLFLATLLATLVANPIFAALVSRFPRRVFIPGVYGFFLLNMLVFYVLFRSRAGGEDVWIARAFYVWLSVINLFAVSVFWSLMVELFRTDQSKRLFGLIGVGGTLGAIVGAGLTRLLVERIGEINLLPISMFLLLAAIVCIVWLNRLAARATRRGGGAMTPTPDEPVHGGFLAGITHLAKSPYLLGIAGFLFLYSVSSTLAYFLQASIVAEAFEDRLERTKFFASLDVMINVVTIMIQVFWTGRIITRIGTGLTLAVLPLATTIGFVVLWLAPTLPVLFAFQVCRRASNFALAKPARESLFTVVSREDKYKAKNLLDTFVHRAGDTVVSTAATKIALTATLAAALAVPLGVVWIGLAIALGRRQRTLAEIRKTPP